VTNIVLFPASDRPIAQSEIDRLHAEAFRNLENSICDCLSMARIAAQEVTEIRTENRELVLRFATSPKCWLLSKPTITPLGTAKIPTTTTRPELIFRRKHDPGASGHTFGARQRSRMKEAAN
jgi:hypothetical protein